MKTAIFARDKIVIFKTAIFARDKIMIWKTAIFAWDKIVILKADLPMFAYYSNAPDSPYCPTCTHNRSHTVDLKSRYFAAAVKIISNPLLNVFCQDGFSAPWIEATFRRSSNHPRFLLSGAYLADVISRSSKQLQLQVVPIPLGPGKQKTLKRFHVTVQGLARWRNSSSNIVEIGCEHLPLISEEIWHLNCVWG